MKVFISWSGELSKQVAQVLHDWIEDVLQGTEARISSDDIDKGSLWFGEIGNGLSETGIGILCLTKDNINAPWVLFEAGALSKGLSKNRVCPLLVNLNATDLKPPLSQFNATLPTKEDMLKLIKTINAQNKEAPLTDERVQKAFNQWWSVFETKFSDAIRGYKPTKTAHQRTVEDKVEEILEITRSLQNTLQKSAGHADTPIALAPVTMESIWGKYLEGEKDINDIKIQPKTRKLGDVLVEYLKEQEMKTKLTDVFVKAAEKLESESKKDELKVKKEKN